MMRSEDLVRRMAERIGTTDERVARRIAEASLAALAEALPSRLAGTVAAELPPALAEAMRPARTRATPLEAPAIARRVARRCGLPIGQAREATEVVYATLATLLDAETLGRVQRALPASVAALVRRAEPEAAAAGAHRIAAPSRSRLASSGPGSTHPIATARAPVPAPSAVGQRLSVAHGTRQEDAGETLARARR